LAAEPKIGVGRGIRLREIPAVATSRNRADQELVKALSHPVRLEILETLQGRVASPTELSRELEESLGVISYHARTLVKCGCLELIGCAGRGGVLENFFGIAPRTSISGDF
jgi:DNA-binding transcriptional ArsR family regulator